MAVERNDVWEMWVLWHWRIGIIGHAYKRRRDLLGWLVGGYFSDATHYRRECGKGKPFKIVKVDVTRADP